MYPYHALCIDRGIVPKQIYLLQVYHTISTVDIVTSQQVLWEETTSKKDTCRAAPVTPMEPDKKLIHDVQMLVSRLVEKAPQLIDNFITNLAEAWMHIRCKFDGGKVISHNQSGSWQHRCTGTGLQYNLGKTWGPQVWAEMTKAPGNQVRTN